MNGRILIIDDEAAIRRAFAILLSGEGLTPEAVADGSEALALLGRESFDVALLDFAMPEMDGLAVLRELRRLYPELVVIMITGHGDVALVVEAIKLGAYDYLLKPPNPDHLLMTIDRALEKKKLRQELNRLSRSLDATLASRLGQSPAIRRVIEDIQMVATSDLSLIIEGETGTGKSFIASLIHGLSLRAGGPFIAIDMGAIPETLIESELFGHERGAFTGADRKKKGYFELARGGTLLLDELQNITPQTQGKILQVVEEKRFYPVGGGQPVSADLRIIGATNADLAQAVASRAFRQDLFYRLNEYRISLPPLRERPEDIPFLASRLLNEAATELNRNFSGLDEPALALLSQHPWPGNIRELRNIMRRAALLAPGGELDRKVIDQALGGDSLASARPAKPEADAATMTPSAPLSLEESEKTAIAQALIHTDRNRTKAAAILGITHKTLLAKIKKYALE